MIHRDIKPSNLLLDAEGVVWLTDFGLAKRTDEATLTVSGALMGTPRYMSPEQAESLQRPVDHRTDLYSLGATLYELATGRPVFESATPHGVIAQILTEEPARPRQIRPGLPRDLETDHPDLPGQGPVAAVPDGPGTRRGPAGRPGWQADPGPPRPARRAHDRGTSASGGRRSAGVRLVVAATTLLIVGSFLGWRSYSDWRLGRVVLTTDGPPLTAQVLSESGDEPIGEPFDVGTRTVVPLPAGDYRLRVEGPGLLSQTYRFGVDRGELGTYRIPLDENRLLGQEPIPYAFASDALVLSPGKADFVEWTGQTLIRRDGATGKPVWDASRPAKPWEPRARPGRVDAAAVVPRRRETARQRWSSPPRTSTATARPTSSGRFEARRRSWHSRARTGRCSGLIRPRPTARAGRILTARRGPSRSSRFPGQGRVLGSASAAGHRWRRRRGPHRRVRPLRGLSSGAPASRTATRTPPRWNRTNGLTAAGAWSWPSRDGRDEPCGAIRSIRQTTTLPKHPFDRGATLIGGRGASTVAFVDGAGVDRPQPSERSTSGPADRPGIRARPPGPVCGPRWRRRTRSSGARAGPRARPADAGGVLVPDRSPDHGRRRSARTYESPLINPPPNWPVIVDLDGDGRSEIVVADSGPLARGHGYRGVRMLDGASGADRWVRPMHPEAPVLAPLAMFDDGLAHVIDAPGSRWRWHARPGCRLAVRRPESVRIA